MKKVLKQYASLKNYVAFLRKQPHHMQHLYAILFAGIITAGIAAIILYVDYGFWHEKYSSKQIVEDTQTSKEIPESPREMLSRFLNEAKIQFSNLDASGSQLLEGKETYEKDNN